MTTETSDKIEGAPGLLAILAMAFLPILFVFVLFLCAVISYLFYDEVIQEQAQDAELTPAPAQESGEVLSGVRGLILKAY
jgi:hypothetical protein